MALTNAEKQKRWRDKRNRLAKRAESGLLPEITLEQVRALYAEFLCAIARTPRDKYDRSPLPGSLDAPFHDQINDTAAREEYGKLQAELTARWTIQVDHGQLEGTDEHAAFDPDGQCPGERVWRIVQRLESATDKDE